MELIHIAGDTYYINDSTTIGVYVFNDKSCLLFDSAAHKRSAMQILDLLSKKGLSVYAILNTHCHGDHCGGNHYIQEQTGCRIYATPGEAVMIENTVLQATILYGAFPPKILRNPYIMPQPSQVTDIITPGDLLIKEKVFTVLDLSGHTMEQCGYCTPDGVAFVGDSLIDPSIINHSPYIFLSNLKKHFLTLEYISQLKNTVVLGHGGWQKDLSACIRLNKQVLEDIVDDYLGLLKDKALGREEIVYATMKKRHIHANTIQYYLTLTTVAAYLAYLWEEKKIRSFMQDGFMKFAAIRD